MFPFEHDLLVEALDEARIATANLSNNLPYFFENFLAAKLSAKGIHDRCKEASFDLAPLQNSDFVRFNVAVYQTPSL